MRNALMWAFTLIFLSQVLAVGQTSNAKSILGTVTAFNAEAKAIEIKPDDTLPVPFKLLANTIIQKIAPGETNLRNAVAISSFEVAIGDRALLTLGPNGSKIGFLLLDSN